CSRSTFRFSKGEDRNGLPVDLFALETACRQREAERFKRTTVRFSVRTVSFSRTAPRSSRTAVRLSRTAVRLSRTAVRLSRTAVRFSGRDIHSSRITDRWLVKEARSLDFACGASRSPCLLSMGTPLRVESEDLRVKLQRRRPGKAVRCGGTSSLSSSK